MKQARVVIVASVTAFALIAIGFTIDKKRTLSVPPAVPTSPSPNALTHHPELYCDFYDVMRKNVVVSFNFDVDMRDPKHPAFSEKYVVEPDNTRIDYGTPEMPSPTWTYAIDDGTPTIVTANTNTRIVLYGLLPDWHGITWIEAGIRSNSYRNLEGKCRQAYFAH